MKLQLLDSDAGLLELQSALVRLLLIDPIEKNSYVGVGTTQKRGMSEIVALSDAPSDSSVFEAAMHRATKEIHSRIGAFREPSYSVIDSGAIQPAARPAMGGTATTSAW